MTSSPSGGWREVYEWCHVDEDQHDRREDLDGHADETESPSAEGDVQNNVIRRGV